MADPLANAQFAQALFSWIPSLAQRNGEQRAQLALAGLRRQQELEDQARLRQQALADQDTKFSQQKELTNLTNDRYLQVEDERSKRALEVEDERTRRANEREDAVRLKATDREARRAYAAYATLAADAAETPKPFAEFGKDPEDAITAISQEMSRLQAKQNDAAFSGTVEGYNRRLKALRAMSQPTEEEAQGLTQQVIGKMIPEDTSEENWGKAIGAIAQGSEDLGLKLMGPKDRAAFLGQRAQGLTALRVLRTKDPAYIATAREVSDMQQAIVQASFKNPKWAKMFGQLGQDAEAPAAPAGITIESFEAAAGKKPGSNAPPKASPTKSTPKQNGYGGLLGLILRPPPPAEELKAAINPGSGALDVLKYAPGTSAQLLGGEKLVSDLGLDTVDSKILAARDYYARNGWIKAATDAVLRSLFSPRNPTPVNTRGGMIDPLLNQRTAQ